LCALISGSKPPCWYLTDEEGHRASPDPVIDELAELLKKIEERISNHVFFNLSSTTKSIQLYYRAALKEVHLRMPTYPHMPGKSRASNSLLMLISTMNVDLCLASQELRPIAVLKWQ